MKEMQYYIDWSIVKKICTYNCIICLYSISHIKDRDGKMMILVIQIIQRKTRSRKRNESDLYNELWVKTCTGYGVAYVEDLDVAKRRMNENIWEV